MPRWSTRDLILAGSIAANLVLLGFLVGAGVRLAGPGAAAPPPEAFDGASPRALLFALEPEQRARIREEMVSEGLRSAPLFRELRDARRDLEAAVTAEPFDAEAARTALERQREIGRELQERGDELILRIVSDLTPEQRAHAVETMREQAERFRERGDRRGDRNRQGGPDGPPPSEPPPPLQPE
jgi:Spy/CpxP family protein refolding chaperone